MRKRVKEPVRAQLLDLQGVFWSVTKPGHWVAGRLQFNGIDEARLDLVGEELIDAIPGEIDAYRIQGEAGSQELALDQCHLTSVSLGSFTSNQSFRAGVVVGGTLFGQNEALEFKGIIYLPPLCSNGPPSG